MCKEFNVKVPRSKVPPDLGIANLQKRHPEINFKFLDKCNVGCFYYLSEYHRKHREEKIFKQLQHFLAEAEQCQDATELIRQYTSKTGSKIDGENKYVKKLVKVFGGAYPKDAGLVESGVIHIHLKRGGKDKAVIFGVQHDNIFYVLAFDPDHSFDRKK